MTKPGILEIHDEIAGTSPHIYTEALHTDTKFVRDGEREYSTEVGGVTLKARVLSPPQVDSKIEPNVVMGPGRPGSVDKGSLEPRGERLLVTTKDKAAEARFQWELRF